MRLTGDSRKVRVIYGNRLIDQIAYREELGEQDVVYVLSEPPETWQGETGFIDAELMDRVFSEKEISEWLFVMCGPSIMMDTPSHRILSERFSYD